MILKNLEHEHSIQTINPNREIQIHIYKAANYVIYLLSEAQASPLVSKICVPILPLALCRSKQSDDCGLHSIEAPSNTILRQVSQLTAKIKLYNQKLDKLNRASWNNLISRSSENFQSFIWILLPGSLIPYAFHLSWLKALCFLVCKQYSNLIQSFIAYPS